MKVTYQKLLDGLYLKNQNPKFKIYDIEKALLGSHEICPKEFEQFKDKYWKDRTPSFGVLNFLEVAMLYFEYDHLDYLYFEFTFPLDFKGKTFTPKMQRVHCLEDKLSRYPSNLFKKIVSSSSKIWVVKGKKYVKDSKYPDGWYNIMMLKCKSKESGDFKYYDIVEDPDGETIDLSKYKKTE